MERNTKTTLDQLTPGDRFYKAGDSKKELWTKTLDEGKSKSFTALKDGQKFAELVRGDLEVIFLRHELFK